MEPAGKEFFGPRRQMKGDKPAIKRRMDNARFHDMLLFQSP
jgi:hypothetical protein